MGLLIEHALQPVLRPYRCARAIKCTGNTVSGEKCGVETPGKGGCSEIEYGILGVDCDHMRDTCAEQRFGQRFGVTRAEERQAARSFSEEFAQFSRTHRAEHALRIFER